MKKWIIIMSVLATTFLSASQVIILLGPPGAGKGTQAFPLSNNLRLPHISTGDLFRAHLKNKTTLGIKAKEYIDKGELVPDALALSVLQDRISESDCKNGYILDGFPRTYNQAKALEKILNKNDLVKIVYLNVPDALLVKRIAGRLSCSDCGAVCHKTFSPPKIHLQCDLCHGALIQRKDDMEEIVRKRLVVYHSQTKSLIEFYKAKGDFLEIDIDQEKDKEEILEKIKSYFVKPVCVK